MLTAHDIAHAHLIKSGEWAGRILIELCSPDIVMSFQHETDCVALEISGIKIVEKNEKINLRILPSTTPTYHPI